MVALSSLGVRRTLRRIAICSVILGLFFEGARFLSIYQTNRLLFEFGTGENLRASLLKLAGLDKSYSQSLQDSWIVLSVMPNKRDGFYVDVGSADGELISNTRRLDELGWKGVCIDPFPTNMERRTCQVFREPVFSESGKIVKFRTAGLLGGIDSLLNTHRDETSGSRVVELVTATLDEILSKANAPKHIDYMSIDVEGAEFEVLRGFSLGKYDVGAFTIEHNNEPEKRAAIRQFLEARGYVYVRSWDWDDWYLCRDLASKSRTR
jgi:FkbM family methyltransferase